MSSSIKDLKIWQVAVYIRLSVEDGDDKIESNSISNQRKMLNMFINNEKDLVLVDYYVDDGYSGTNFDRPDFKRMLVDIKDGKIDTVIVKDLSRLGRNYIEVGNYIEQIFPLYNIRFIAVNDNIDSYKDPSSVNNIIVPFKNLMNDEYCRDISNKVKSITTTKKRNGEFMGSTPPYGYIRDPEDKHHFLIDDEAANVIKSIFNMTLDGTGKRKIAEHLNDTGVLSPNNYKRKKLKTKCGNNYDKEENEEIIYWSDKTIDRILRNQTYCGDMIQGKVKKVSYKMKKIVKVPKEKWIVVKNTHQPIIDRETFSKINGGLFTRDTRVNSNGDLSIFAGYLKCNDCKHSMTRKNSKSKTYEAKTGKKRYVYYCSTYSRKSHSLCTKHLIRSDTLTKAVLEAIKLQIDLVINIDNTIQEISKMKKINYDEKMLETNIKTLEQELSKFKTLKKKLYEDWKLEIISKDEYLEYSKDYDKNIVKLTENIDNTKEQLKKTQNITENNNDWIDKFKSKAGIEELSKPIIDDLIDNIYICEDEKIIVSFKYKDEYQNALEFINKNKVYEQVC